MKTACNTDKALSSNQLHSDDAQNPRKLNHDAQELLRRQMQQAVLLYGSGESHPSLQKIADELALNPIKVRKLLITAGVYRSDIAARVQRLRENPTEKTLWNCIVAFRNYPFTTLSGLPFTYDLKMGRHGKFTKELWITRRENSKSLTWSSAVLAFRNIKEIGAEVERPKALGDIRGVSYIYALFCRFGLIRTPHGTT